MNFSQIDALFSPGLMSSMFSGLQSHQSTGPTHLLQDNFGESGRIFLNGLQYNAILLNLQYYIQHQFLFHNVIRLPIHFFVVEYICFITELME